MKSTFFLQEQDEEYVDYLTSFCKENERFWSTPEYTKIPDTTKQHIKQSNIDRIENFMNISFVI